MNLQLRHDLPGHLPDMSVSDKQFNFHSTSAFCFFNMEVEKID